jgi:hypothetical protein
MGAGNASIMAQFNVADRNQDGKLSLMCLKSGASIMG